MLFPAVFVNLLQVGHLFTGVCGLVTHVREEEHTDVFIIIFERFKNQEGRNYEEDLGVTLLQLFCKLLMLLRRRLDHLAEMQKLVALLAV